MKRKNELTAVDLLEEAQHLLRSNPAGLLRYYAGSIPFVLGLLYYWADMSRSAYAGGERGELALGLTLAFIWMKCWQASFCRALWRDLGGQAAPRRRPRQIIELVVTQTIIQPWGLILFLPFLLITVPFPFFFAFFQNVTIIGIDEEGGVRGMIRRAWGLAGLWMGQNANLCLCISFFAMLAAINLAVTLALVPFLFKMLFNLQTRFTQSPYALMNTTFLATVAALAYLCVDPLIKAVYVLRCFYGESLKTGEALWAELNALKRGAEGTPGKSRKIATIGLILLLAAGVPAARAQEPDRAGEARGAKTEAAVSPGELDRSIKETLRNPRYAWRMPRKLKAPEQDEVVKGFFGRWLDTIGGWIGSFLHWIVRGIDWFFNLFRPKSRPTPMRAAPSPGIDTSALGAGIFALTKALTCVLLTVLAAAIAFFAVRIWKDRTRQPRQAEAIPGIQAAEPDLASEQTVADQLPTDGWLLLAQQMIDRGELRLALRALYLATLAALAQAGIVRIQRSKSTLDYVRELLRRAHAWPGLMEAFGENSNTFDAAWYGTHEVTSEGIQEFRTNYERIRSLVNEK